MITPQTNCTLEDIAKALRECDNICICGHQNPDGDCLGATLALYFACRKLGKNVVPLFASGDIPRELKSIPGADYLVESCYVSKPCDTFVMLDAAETSRMSEAAEALFNQALLTITLDHHEHNERVSQLSYTDPDAASTCVLVWKLVNILLDKPSKEIAQCCYSGTLTDTGCFKFQNSNEEAFRCSSEMIKAGADAYLAAQTLLESRTEASLRLECVCLQNMIIDADHGIVVSTLTSEDFERCKANKADVDPLVNVLRPLESIRIVALLYEQGGKIRVSMRSKDDSDVALIAKRHGGGGHQAASGCTLDGSLTACRDELLAELIQEFAH